jgi:sulfonate transport system substrate-binding protein
LPKVIRIGTQKGGFFPAVRQRHTLEDAFKPLGIDIQWVDCQIASKCDPLFAAKNDPFDGAETGGAEPHIAEQSRSWRAASGGRAVMRGS